MRKRHFLLICVVLFVAALLWNSFLHLVIFAKVNASVHHLYRADLSDKMWLSLILTAGVVVLFVLGHRYVAAVENGEAQDFSDLARKLKVSYAQVSALVSLTFLSPELQEAVACSTKGVGIGPLGMEGILPLAREWDWRVQGRLWRSAFVS